MTEGGSGGRRDEGEQTHTYTHTPKPPHQPSAFSTTHCFGHRVLTKKLSLCGRDVCVCVCVRERERERDRERENGRPYHPQT